MAPTKKIKREESDAIAIGKVTTPKKRGGGNDKGHEIMENSEKKSIKAN